MRFLLVTGSDLSRGASVGGAETSLLLLARRLADEGHRVVVVFSHARVSRSPVPSIGISEGVWRVGLRRPPTRASLHIRRVSSRMRLHRRLRDRVVASLVGRADLTYSDYRLKSMEMIAAARRRSTRPAPWVVRMAGLHPIIMLSDQPEHRPRYEEAFQQATALNFLLPASQRLFEARAAAAGLRLPSGNSFVWDIGSVIGSTEVIRGLRAEEPFRLVMVGRFSNYQKRQDLLIEALARVRSDVVLTFIGQGPRRPTIEALALERAVGERVEFLDQVPQEAMWDLLAGFHLHCVATEFEGLGKIILESMAVGLPVLASRVPPIDELLTEGVDGFLVDNDVEAWAAAIDRLARDRVALHEVIRPAQSLVRSRFDPVRQAREFIRITEELCVRGPAGQVSTSGGVRS